jgi:hypothetical protein
VSRTDAHEPFDVTKSRDGKIDWATYKGFARQPYFKFVQRMERRKIRHQSKAIIKRDLADDVVLPKPVRNAAWLSD